MNQSTKWIAGKWLFRLVFLGVLITTFGCTRTDVITTNVPSSEGSVSNSGEDFSEIFGTTRDEISIEKAHALWQGGTIFIDVRTQEEWDEVRIPGVPLIPLNELERRLDEVPDDVPVVLQCRSGNRSMQALEILEKAGYSNAVSMSGGIREWEAAGYDVEKGP
jgi:rhodanese-related sulfurtransferase